MKIEKIEVAANKITLRKPFKIALGVITEVSNLTITVVTDTGEVGIGEATPEPLVTGETLEGCEAALNLLETALIGEDPRQLSRIHGLMNQCMKGNGSAKAAIDMACYDLLGKSTGLPLYQLLGGQDNQVETDMTISIDTPEVMAQNAQQYVEQGFSALKVKVGLDEKDDIERVKQIRAAVGSAIELRIDANQGWQAKQAVKMIEQLQKYDIAFFEQPTQASDVDGLSFVRANVSQQIMADEAAFIPEDALSLIKKEAVDAVNIKLMKCGGIYPALQINSICEAANIPCMVGCMAGETNISIAAATHFVAAQKNVCFADLDATFDLATLAYEGVVSTEKTPIIKLTKAAGLGIKPKEEGVL
jgi:L-alanine-DL-glutamate epimerase-like enolase superfamily enzyme